MSGREVAGYQLGRRVAIVAVEDFHKVWVRKIWKDRYRFAAGERRWKRGWWAMLGELRSQQHHVKRELSLQL